MGLRPYGHPEGRASGPSTEALAGRPLGASLLSPTQGSELGPTAPCLSCPAFRGGGRLAGSLSDDSPVAPAPGPASASSDWPSPETPIQPLTPCLRFALPLGNLRPVGGRGLNLLFLSLAGWEGVGSDLAFQILVALFCIPCWSSVSSAGECEWGKKGRGSGRGCMWVGMLLAPGGWLNLGFCDAL